MSREKFRRTMDFSDDYLEAIVKKCQSAPKAMRVLNVERTGVVEIGENYTCDIRRAKMKVRCKDGLIREVRLIIKVAPTEKAKRAFLMEAGVFDREIKVYRDVLSAMERLCEENEIHIDPIWPKCHDYKSNTFIIFEDLSAQNYRLADRKKRLDFDHACLVFGALGRLHGLSVVLKDKEMFDPFEFDFFAFCFENDALDRMYNMGISGMAKTMRNDWGEEWAAVADDLETLLNTVRQKIAIVCKRKEDAFNVLCHGDPWTNNMLFKYCPFSEKPIGIKFLDFQCSHYRSYGIDLNYTIYTSVQGNVREERLDDLLRVYHESLVKTLEMCNHEPSNVPSFEGVKAEVERTKFFGLAVIASILHMFTAEKENVQDLDEMASNPSLKVPQATLKSRLYIETAQNIFKEIKDKPFFSLFTLGE